jgi:hypothetical protein
MRKLIVLLSILIVVFLAGCSTAKPESTVTAFAEAGKKFDLVKMAETINPSNTNNKEKIQDFTKNGNDPVDQYQKFFIDYFKENAAKITYQIKGTTVAEDKATVTVDFKYVNGAPLLKGTISDVFAKAISMAFTGMEINDEEMGQMFVTSMKNQQQTIQESFTEKTLDIKLVLVDSKWYIDDLGDELLDVFTSNFISVGNELDKSFNSTTEDAQDLTFMEQAKKDNMTIINQSIGDEITLATVKLKINRVEEKQTITPEYGSPENAKEGAKFVIVNADITNITDKPFTMSPDLLIVDNKERQFKASDAIMVLDDYLDYKELSPSIRETGSWLYELPQDATSYSLAVTKLGTNELYMIKLN